MIFKILFFIFVVCLCSTSAKPKSNLYCKDENGKPLDWFSIYKLPKSAKNKNEFVQIGTAYTFLTEYNTNWTLSSKSLGDANSLAGQSLNPLYVNTFDEYSPIGYIMYNDQFGGDSDAEDEGIFNNQRKAHAKGVLMFDETNIVWIIHSIPNYPPRPKNREYKLSASQSIYGQSMLCLSLPIESLEKVAKQLMYAYPQIYDSFISDSFRSNPKIQLNTLNKVIAGERVKQAPYFSVETLTTFKGNNFAAFHKDTKFDQDLYEYLVANQIRSSLFTETWSHGVGTMATSCNSSFPVYNIKDLNVPIANVKFSVTSDHSKWAINLPKDNRPKYTCIGDINRQNSQKKRGGGTVCFINNVGVWYSYFNLIDSTENCDYQKVSPKTINA